MQLKRSSLVYRVNFGNQHPNFVPESVGVCWLFWRTLIRLILFPILAIWFYTIVTPIAFLFGHRPVNLVSYYTSQKFYSSAVVKIERLPEIRGHRVWPGVILVLFLATAVIGWVLGTYAAFWMAVISGTIPLGELATAMSLVLTIFIVLMVLIFCFCAFFPSLLKGLTRGMQKIRNSSLTELTVTMVQAWKQKYCPIVRIE